MNKILQIVKELEKIPKYRNFKHLSKKGQDNTCRRSERVLLFDDVFCDLFCFR